ncbi:unnamed protein product, partial [Iphiclides podalirius]
MLHSSDGFVWRGRIPTPAVSLNSRPARISHGFVGNERAGISTRCRIAKEFLRKLISQQVLETIGPNRLRIARSRRAKSSLGVGRKLHLLHS